MSLPKVAIIIINWNGWRDTLECLESVFQINYPLFDLIVIDNDSEDSSIQKIKDYCNGKVKVQSEFINYNTENKPIKIIEHTNKELESSQIKIDKSNDYNRKLTLIKNDKNYGFTGGNNIGMKHAIKTLHSDYILLLNNDTVVDENFIIEMMKVAKTDEDIGFVGPKVYIYNDKNRLQVAGGAEVDLKYGEVDEIAYHKIDDGKFDLYLEPDYIGGTCILCKKEVIEKIGLLDPTYFMYWEDADWCFRGRKHGYKSVYAFKSKIWHKYGASSENPFRMYYFTRNRLYFMKKNISSIQFIQFSIFLAAVISYKCLYQLIRLRNIEMCTSYLKGYIHGLKVSYNI